MRVKRKAKADDHRHGGGGETTPFYVRIDIGATSTDIVQSSGDGTDVYGCQIRKGHDESPPFSFSSLIESFA